MPHAYATWLVYIHQTWLIHMWLCVVWFRPTIGWHDSSSWDMTHFVDGSFVYKYQIWLIHKWVCIVWFRQTAYRGTWRIHIRHDSFFREMTRSYVWDWLMYVWLCVVWEANFWGTWPIYMRHDSFFWDIICSYVRDVTHSQTSVSSLGCSYIFMYIYLLI